MMPSTRPNTHEVVGSVPPPAGPSRFYLPSPTALSRESSRHLDRRTSSMSLSASVSVPTSPRSHYGHGDRRHLRSRSSIAALRAALQNYQVPPEVELDPFEHIRHGHAHGHGHSEGDSDEPVSELYLDHDRHALGSERGYTRSLEGRSLGLKSGLEDGNEMMDALVDIHRVLYRGRENLDDLHQDWDGEEIVRVAERWFEGDCSYDHPLVQLASRSSLLSHFQLLHILSTLHLPSISPKALVSHTRSITSSLRSRILGQDTLSIQDLERRPSVKGKEKEGAWDDEEAEVAREREGWWKVWDVKADCIEIGGMECYDGYHLALIEHTITLTLLPSLSSRSRQSISSIPSSPATYATDETPSPLQARIPNPPFLTRLAQSLAEEFDYLLHWDLPISTFVEFNEVGKATKIRDVVDVRDAIETFIPFAKRLGWLTRRVTGLVTSTLGAVVVGLVARPKVVVMQPIRVGSSSGPSGAEKIKLEYASGLGLGELSMASEDERKLVGLEGLARPDSEKGSEVGSMAPDCDCP